MSDDAEIRKFIEKYRQCARLKLPRDEIGYRNLIRSEIFNAEVSWAETAIGVARIVISYFSDSARNATLAY